MESLPNETLAIILDYAVRENKRVVLVCQKWKETCYLDKTHKRLIVMNYIARFIYSLIAHDKIKPTIVCMSMELFISESEMSDIQDRVTKTLFDPLVCTEDKRRCVTYHPDVCVERTLVMTYKIKKSGYNGRWTLDFPKECKEYDVSVTKSYPNGVIKQKHHLKKIQAARIIYSSIRGCSKYVTSFLIDTLDETGKRMITELEKSGLAYLHKYEYIRHGEGNLYISNEKMIHTLETNQHIFDEIKNFVEDREKRNGFFI